MNKNLIIAAIAGAAAGGLVWMFAKGELERDFGAGAADLEERLRTSGRALTAETSTLCRAVARKAIDERLRSLGFTPALLRDTSRTLATLNELVAEAERRGLNPLTLVRRLG